MQIPEPGPRVARHNSALLRRWGRWFLSRRGWKVRGNLPDLSHMILLGVPHTSNWDLLYCLAFECALGFKANWVGKQSLFFWPLGPLMRRLGGVPVNRRFPRQMPWDTVAHFRERTHLILAIAPEGTRRKVEKWKQGFHRIARATDVPLVPICMDSGTRVFAICPPYIATENVEDDIRSLKKFLKISLSPLDYRLCVSCRLFFPFPCIRCVPWFEILPDSWATGRSLSGRFQRVNNKSPPRTRTGSVVWGYSYPLG